MRRSGRLGACVVVAVVAAIGAGFPAQVVPPEEWARSLCTSFREWSGALTTARAQFDPNDPDIPARRRALVAYLETATDSTRALLRQLEETGAPDVDDGKAIARVFRRAIREARQAFAAAAEDAAEIEARRVERFERAQNRINDRIQDARADVARPFDEAAERYDFAELDAAFEAEPACTGTG
jgi:hypothetical protein